MTLKPRTFRRLSLDNFGKELANFGFQSVPIKGRAYRNGPVYFRINDSEIYHFIAPELNNYGAWFDIKVSGHSPIINKQFDRNFENGIDFPSDSHSYLSDISGVGWAQTCFKSKSEGDFMTSFEQRAMPALRKYALPYLDRIQTLEQLVSTIPQQARRLYDIPPELSRPKDIISRIFDWGK